MISKRIFIIVLALSVMLGGSLLLGVGKTEKKTGKASQVIVGTFDSRAVTLAFGSSPISSTFLKRRDPESVAPKADATPEEVEQWKINRRKIEFRQGFGTGDVSVYLDLIRDDIPKIAKKTGVDVIVSKWDIEYHGPKVKFVDVTEALIQPFGPTEERIKIIRDVMAKPPLSEKKIRELERRDGID